jgi:serine/threonine protein kinase
MSTSRSSPSACTSAGVNLPLSSGTKLGPYEIVSALGGGAEGEVYRARDSRLDRTVAIKFYPRIIRATQHCVSASTAGKVFRSTW